ncbi:hypothetical protein GJ698_26705 [Pseudoduganella sp. FT26W]|uniref:Glyoxalase/bleomycin resistance/dioxygenase family protein n=1 Tax=Duganella aquatilis TaxID=2666082 RepID=A0A844D3L2_9BURK|nr:hypothetical protein [Duganella aquatilis]MRW87667.1 hypothetical protein [Duganella aquatilis]
MVAKAGAVLYAKDLAKMSMFYSEVAGLRVTHSESDHMVLESALFQLVLVAIPQKIAAEIEISTPPIRRENTPIKLVFYISSIAFARAVALQFGGELNPVEREWIFQEHKVCDGVDPEGNIAQFREV